MPKQQDALTVEIASFRGKEAALLAVCDGIGGLEEGEYASSYVTMRIREWFYNVCIKQIRRCFWRGKIRRECLRMLYDCHTHLQRYGERYGIKLGTTMTMAVFRHDRYLLFHAGDTRAYVLGRKCRKLTDDDRISGNVLYKCIGSFSWKKIQYKHGRLHRGEIMLLCSDGFWKDIENQEFLDSLGRQKALTEEQLKRRLYKLGQAGRARGEKDNQAAAAVKMGRED